MMNSDDEKAERDKEDMEVSETTPAATDEVGLHKYVSKSRGLIFQHTTTAEKGSDQSTDRPAKTTEAKSKSDSSLGESTAEARSQGSKLDELPKADTSTARRAKKVRFHRALCFRFGLLERLMSPRRKLRRRIWA